MFVLWYTFEKPLSRGFCGDETGESITFRKATGFYNCKKHDFLNRAQQSAVWPNLRSLHTEEEMGRRLNAVTLTDCVLFKCSIDVRNVQRARGVTESF